MDAVLCYDSESTTVGKVFYGRLAANAGIAMACARYGSGAHLHCVTPSDEDGRHLLTLMHERGIRDKGLVRIRNHPIVMPDQDLGTLFRLDPNIGSLLWSRAFAGQDAGFSVCGFTHSLTPLETQDWLGQLMSAPAQPWDAVICTSRAARSMVATLFEGWRDYIRGRGGVSAGCPVRLPVIPLGVDCGDFDPGTPAAQNARAVWRARLELGENDVAVLFSGRLSFNEKAHPVPMFLALEEAQRRTRRRLHFLMAGRFPHPGHEEMFRNAAATFAPSVPIRFLDGGDPAMSGAIRFAADIFLSLSDNLQETFGLTPVEAMAAGLPVVASAWDGYRDTVADGESGILIPATQPPAGGLGEAMGAGHYLQRDYLGFLGAASQVTAVDVGAAAEALLRLAEDDDLRRGMAAAARRRALACYDWSVIVPQYEALWAELRTIRERAPVPPRLPLPLSLDPQRLFAGFTARPLDDDWTVRATDGHVARLEMVLTDPLCLQQAPAAPANSLRALVRAAAAPVRLGDLMAAVDGAATGGEAIRHRVAWLAKMHVLALTPPADPSTEHQNMI